MKVITCASFYGTGSSAITDLLTEYEHVKSHGEYELSFVHEFDGISDLEYHLTECHNRNNSSVALKRFEKKSKFNAGKFFNKRYEPFFQNQYLSTTREYLEELIEFKVKGHAFFEQFDKGLVYYYFQSLLTKIMHLAHVHMNTMPNEYLYYSHPSKEKFLELTQNYTHALLKLANKDNSEFLIIDQLLPSSNISRCLRYFKDDVKVIVVDRDPRDIYVSCRFVWKDDRAPVDPYEFCQWYRYARESSKGQEVDPTKVLKIQFEDLIYDYLNSVNKIENFIGIDNKWHSMKFKKLNPKRSFVNTQKWKKYNVCNEIEIIENQLPEYIYNFSRFDGITIEGIDNNNKKAF